MMMQKITKKITAITPTGSSHLATILAKIAGLGVTAFSLALIFGCHSEPEKGQFKDPSADYFCTDDCDTMRRKPFLSHAIHLEIEPTGKPSQVFYNVDPAVLALKPIVLSKAVRINGKALGAESYVPDDEGGSNHDKSISFSDIIAIPTANKISFLSPRIPTVKSRLTHETGYELELWSGLAYTMILNPGGNLDRAPIHLNPGVISSDSQLDFRLDQNQSRLQGRIVSTGAEIPIASAAPLMRARVMQGHRLISSIGTVSKDGKFSLEISRPLFDESASQPISLVVEPVDIEVALPRVKMALEKDELASDLDVGEVDLGKLKKPISVTIDVHGSDDSSIGNAFLFLKAKIGAGETFVKKQVDNSGSTKFTHLFEGIYDIAVVPPSNSKFAMRVIKAVEFDSTDNTEISIDLHKRGALNAVVYGPNGKSIPGALIEFMRIGEIGNFATEDIYDDMLFKLIASTNTNGKVCHRKFGFTTTDNNECLSLLLDEGRYLAHIIPPAGTELSHKWVTFDFPVQNELSITLDQPEVLSGQILSPDGKTPIARGFITVYLAETNTLNQPKIIGNAITDSQGFFKAFVSAP